MEWRNWLSVATSVLSIATFIASVIFLLIRKPHIIKYFLIGIGLVLAITAMVLAVIPFPRPCDVNCTQDVKITSPQNNATVPLEITVQGYTTIKIPEYMHLYIVVEYGNKWWPQIGEIPTGYSNASGYYEFNVPIRVGIPEDIGKDFRIKALLVDSVANELFQSWFQQNTATKDWPGIPIVNFIQEDNIIKSDTISVTRY